MPDAYLTRLGITEWSELYRNPSYDDLFGHELAPSLDGLERGVLTTFGAVAVDTGRFTGRSPQDKYIVEEESSQKNIWWAGPDSPGSNNKRLTVDTWNHLKDLALKTSVEQIVSMFVSLL